MQAPTQQDFKKVFHHYSSKKPPHSNKSSSHGQTAVFALYTFHCIELKISVLTN